MTNTAPDELRCESVALWAAANMGVAAPIPTAISNNRLVSCCIQAFLIAKEGFGAMHPTVTVLRKKYSFNRSGWLPRCRAMAYTKQLHSQTK